MEPRISFITLGVADLDRATRFYAEVLKLPRIPMPDGAGVSFFEMGKTWLSLFPREDLTKDAGVSAEGSGFAGFTLAHNVDSIEAVDALFAELRAAGVKIVKEPVRAPWGGYSGYFADSEAFLWEVAWNPHFPHA
ncbi:MAG: glyoxalase [Panacagrimonas sp.]|jgi:catechol 2,3-dioxygenase-like lactoylglutathione lyase family enzyme|nr:VOC family protein [Panacagrimonas sp.]MCC2656240.1 glyoxalase [Panacagrimonas sp.]